MADADAEKAIRALASELAGVTRSVACEGTKLESTTYAVAKKNFLFVRVADGTVQLRLKLSASLKDAEARAKKAPQRFDVGAQGWVKVTFPVRKPPPAALLKKWIEESYGGYAAR